MPPSVGRCPALREVSLDLNRLGALPAALLWLPRLDRASLAANLIEALPLEPPEPPRAPLAVTGSDESEEDDKGGRSGGPGAAPFGKLRHLDLSYNAFSAVAAAAPPWLLEETPLEGLGLGGNGLTAGAFLALPGSAAFMAKRKATKNKGQGGCWFAPGGVSSFGFCGLDSRP